MRETEQGGPEADHAAAPEAKPAAHPAAGTRVAASQVLGLRH